MYQPIDPALRDLVAEAFAEVFPEWGDHVVCERDHEQCSHPTWPDRQVLAARMLRELAEQSPRGRWETAQMFRLLLDDAVRTPDDES